MKKCFKYFLYFVILGLLLSGCSQISDVRMKSQRVEYSGDDIYPLKSNDTLTVWANASSVKDLNNDPFGLEWKKQTGVNVTFEQPTSNSAEALSLLIASGDLPDILITGLTSQPGGIQKYANDNIIIPLNDYMQFLPNLEKYLSENKEVDKMVKSDDGKYYHFPFIRGDEKLTVSSGPVVRKDLLDKENIAIPETIDEWRTVLQVFKKYGAKAPLSYNLLLSEDETGGFIFGAYGTRIGFYVEEGKVKYGPLEPEFKEALTTLHSWYAEGLLDPNIANVSATLDANILNSDTCATVCYAGGGIGKYMTAMADKNPSFNLEPAPYPVLKKGDKPQFGRKDFAYIPSNNAYITTACKNIELAARFLDYGYSEKGHLLFNFGIEGVSYNMENGYPKYTDLIMKNPDGLAPSVIMNKYLMGNVSGPFVQDVRYVEQYYVLDQQKRALEVWGNTDVQKYNIPPIAFTESESNCVSTIRSNVETRVQELIFKYIMGINSLDDYDAFVSGIKQFGIDEAIDIYTAALARYNNR